MKNKILELFKDLISYNTQSDSNSEKYPSTNSQLIFGKHLFNICERIGLEEISIDSHGYVTATLPANTDEEIPIIGLISHMDTSPEFPGERIRITVTENYDGESIELKNKITLSPNEFPELNNYIGKTIITSDGTTLLGADDKAGITEILTAVQFIKNSPEIKHGKIRIAFTPDEEIGKGVDYFDADKFGCDFAYTIDGGEIGELNFENFNAACAVIEIKGKSVHPGFAKNKMINSMLVANEFISSLPVDEIPEATENYEGFYHLIEISGNVEHTKMKYIIRDFDKNNFENRKQTLYNCVEAINNRFGAEIIVIKIYDEYYNMLEKLNDKMHIIEIAEKAMIKAGVKPNIKPIRGGTDGARLSYMGLPCPNIFTGGHNFHGPYEFIVLESMEKAVETIVNICYLNN